MTDRDTLSEAFTKLLEDARQAYTAYITSQGLPFTEFVRRIAIVDKPEQGGWYTDAQSIEQSTARKHLFDWGPMSEQLKDDCLSLSADLIENFSSSLPFWSVGWGGPISGLLGLPAEEQIEFSSEPTNWVARYIVVPALLEYLRSLPSAETSDESLAAQIANEALDLVTSRDLKMTTYIPVLGVEMDVDQLTSADISVRRLTPLERGDLWQQMEGFTTFSGADLADLMPYSRLPVTAIPTSVLAVTVATPRMSQPQPGPYHKLALCSFYLHGYPLTGPGRTTSDS